MSSRSQFRSADGCCICGTKSSSSRFSNSARFSQYFSKCFGPRGEGRHGDICNACVLYVKRWCKASDQTTGKYEKVLDKKKGPGLKHITQIVKMQQRKQARLKAFGSQNTVASHGMETRSKNQKHEQNSCCSGSSNSESHYHHHGHHCHHHHYHHFHHLMPNSKEYSNLMMLTNSSSPSSSTNASNTYNSCAGSSSSTSVSHSGNNPNSNLDANNPDNYNCHHYHHNIISPVDFHSTSSNGNSNGHSINIYPNNLNISCGININANSINNNGKPIDSLSQDSLENIEVFRVPDSSCCRTTTRNSKAKDFSNSCTTSSNSSNRLSSTGFSSYPTTRTANYKKRVQKAPVKLPNADEVDHLLREIMAINSQVVNFEIPLVMQNHLRLRSRTIINNNGGSQGCSSSNYANTNSSCGDCSSTGSIQGNSGSSNMISSGSGSGLGNGVNTIGGGGNHSNIGNHHSNSGGLVGGHISTGNNSISGLGGVGNGPHNNAADLLLSMGGVAKDSLSRTSSSTCTSSGFYSNYSCSSNNTNGNDQASVSSDSFGSNSLDLLRN